MQTQFFAAAGRGSKHQGWLRSQFHFSFSDYSQPVKSAFGTLVAFNNDYLQAGKGFGIHPHVNMEIISVLLKGKMNHKDTLGYSTAIEEGGVQIMSAGSGLRHDEYNIGDDEVNFLQIWIQPKLQNITPRYQTRRFPLESRRNQLTTIISGEEGLAHCWINQNAKLSLGHFDKNESTTYPFSPVNKCLFIYNITGNLQVSETKLGKGDALGVWDTDMVTIQALEESQYLIIETVVNQK